MNTWWIVAAIISAMTFYEVFYLNGGYIPGWLYLGIMVGCILLLVKYPRIGRRKS